MALHSISEAARLTKKARSTIHRHIKEGRISKVEGEDGKPAIETSELQRVYGKLSHDATAATPFVIQPATIDRVPDLHDLERQIAALTAERDSLANERDRWAAQAERLTLLLTNDAVTAPQANQGRVGWFDRLLGRG